ncbi:MAG TPA: GlsB/YeaQ/YmgE family stress response membrane protein [Xanthobacteraceae bacterium]|nr:GlsB/YeaQ/YmgE family stress response membrane protein [Xanthobacteraceae bacterium]
MSLLWIIIIGFLAGLIARWLAPGPNTPTGFLLTTALGIAGAFVSTFIGQAIGWYRPDQGAGLIGAIVGALIVLFVWHRLVASNVIGDPGAGPKR